MAGTPKLFLVLAAAFLGLVAEPLLTFVNGDGALVNVTCSRTPKPNYCLQCFSTEDPSRPENLESLGRASIDCASVQSIDTMATVEKLIVNATNQAFKDACVDCFERLSSGDQKITKALLNWQNKVLPLPPGRFSALRRLHELVELSCRSSNTLLVFKRRFLRLLVSVGHPGEFSDNFTD